MYSYQYCDTVPGLAKQKIIDICNIANNLTIEQKAVKVKSSHLRSGCHQSSTMQVYNNHKSDLHYLHPPYVCMTSQLLTVLE